MVCETASIRTCVRFLLSNSLSLHTYGAWWADLATWLRTGALSVRVGPVVMGLNPSVSLLVFFSIIMACAIADIAFLMTYYGLCHY